MSGEKIGQYEIKEHLGRGGMADVYKAVHPGLSVNRAIKVIRPELVRSDDFRIRFQKEAHTVAELRHPNIVQVHDFGSDGERFYMVMEFIEGQDLGQLLKLEGRIRPIQRALNIVIRIASALEYAHSQDIVHRDIKPDNIMVSNDGTPILMDFGIAKLLTSDTKLTQQGLGIGTPAYMAPEQATAVTDVGPSADIYALTIVLYEMLTGTVPFKADSAMAVMLKAINEPLPPPRDIATDISEELQAVIFKGSAKDPGDRYQSIAQLRAALQQVAGEPDPDQTFPRQRPISGVVTPEISQPLTQADEQSNRVGFFTSVSGQVVSVLAGMFLIAGIYVFFLFAADKTPTGRQPVGGATEALHTSADHINELEILGPDVLRVAVYPFTADLPDSLSHLRQSLGNEVRYNLARSTGLQVVYRGSGNADESNSGRLRRAVDLNLKGDLQLQGDNGYLQVRLERPSEDVLWTESYPFSLHSAIRKQQMIAVAVAAVINDKFPDADIRFEPFTEVQLPAAAYEKFLRGSLLMQQRGARAMDESIQLFNQVVDAQPEFARAHLSLAYVYVTLPTYANRGETQAFQLAELALARVEKLEPGFSGEVTGIRAYIALRRWRWDEARVLFEQALREAPNSAEIHGFYSQMLASTGDVAGAIAYAKRAWDLNAYSPNVNAVLAVSFIWQGALEEAAHLYQVGDELGLQDLGNPGKLLLLALQKKEKEATLALSQVHESFGLPSDWVAPVVKGIIDPDYQASASAAFDAAISNGFVISRMHWPIWILLGNTDRAFATFERLAQAGEFLSLDIELLSSRLLDDFRADLRYPMLADRYGLPPN